MLNNLDGNFFLILSVLVFVAVMLLLEGLFMTWNTYKGPSAKKIQKRLQALSAVAETERSLVIRQNLMSELPVLERLLYSLPRAHALDRMLVQADLRWSVSRLLLTCGALGAGTYMLVGSMLRQPASFSLPLTAGMMAIPMLYVMRRRAKRLAKLEVQLPDALDLLTRALRAGHAFSSGMQMISDEMADPIASEFRAVSDEVNFGVSLQQALSNLTERVPVTDLRYFVVSVLIQRESGGNLTEVLGNLSRLIRERLKLMARVKVLSAEGRMSAYILGLMPFALAGLMAWMNPAFMEPLWTDPIGIGILRVLFVTMALGFLLLRKIARIRV